MRPIRSSSGCVSGVSHLLDNRENVQADTLYEAVALAVRVFRAHDCAPGPASQMEVEARSPAVTHTVSMRKVEDWLNGTAKSPGERLLKERLKGLIAS